jgi:glutamate synthase (NADPH/NADH) small chain
VAFGIWRVSQEKDRYTRRRIALLTAAIATLWILIPYLTGSNFFNHHLIGSAWFFAYLLIVFFFGRRADCSWNCPCVGIRDTAGDAFRGKTLKGGWFWKLRSVKWIFLAGLVVYLFLLFAFPFSFNTRKFIDFFWLITTALYFASFLVVPWTGNRNYCRYLCPWGALYGLIGKIGFFKITADRQKCVPCQICEANCDMGIPIRSLVQKYGEIKVSDCVGCGRCVSKCPRQALKIVDIRDSLLRWVSAILGPGDLKKT